MSDPDAYVMLISSLPSPEALFLSKQPPLSRLKLDQRLRVLAPDHAATLKLVESALEWRHLPITAREEDVIARAREAIARVESETLRQVLRDRLELRTCIAALRRRARGDGPPPPGTPWGFGRWVRQIVRCWSEPAFRLEGVFPWLREAAGLIERTNTIALERLILEQSYKQLRRRAGRHLFDFEAVVLYVLEWSVVERWGRYNAAAAARRFEQLAQAGLGAYAALDFDGEA